MKRILYSIIVCMYTAMIHTASIPTQSIVHHQDSPQHNLIILNDITENHNFYENPWDIDDLAHTSRAITFDLLTALAENQLIITSTTLWNFVQYIVQIWSDFSTLSPEELTKIYKRKLKPTQKLATSFSKEFQYGISAYSHSIKRIQEQYEQLNKQTSDTKTFILDPSIFDTTTIFTSPAHKKLDSQSQSDLQEIVTFFFKVYSLYQYIIKSNNYISYTDPNNDFILFIPHNLIQENQDETERFLGMNLKSFLQPYNYQTAPLKSLTQKQLDSINEDPTIIGTKLIQFLSKLFITKHQYEVSLNRNPPKYNIALSGHGSPDTMVAEVSIQSKDKKPSDFKRLLQLLNNNIQVHTLSILSCYPGGKKLQTAFQTMSQYHNPFLGSLHYTILLIGSLMTPTYAPQLPIDIPSNLEADKVQHYLHSNTELFGPDQRKTIWKAFFKTLNTPAQNMHHYLQAAETINSITSGILPMYENYVLVKYPHTEWFTPATHPQTIDITETKSHTKQLTISSTKQFAMLSTNYIPRTITFEYNPEQSNHTNATLMPQQFLNQNYLIEHLVFHNVTTNKPLPLEEVIKQLIAGKLFASKISEPINIVIKKLDSTNKNNKAVQYHNVYLFIHNTTIKQTTSKKNLFRKKTESEKAITGYIYTDDNNVTQIVYWPSNESIEFDEPTITQKIFNNEQAQALMQQVMTHALQGVKLSSAHIDRISEVAKQQAQSSPIRYQLQRKAAARKIQHAYQQYKAKTSKVTQKTNPEAKLLQRIAKGYRARTETQQEYNRKKQDQEKQSQAAQTLQRFGKGYKVRNDLKAKQRTVQPSTTPKVNPIQKEAPLVKPIASKKAVYTTSEDINPLALQLKQQGFKLPDEEFAAMNWLKAQGITTLKERRAIIQQAQQ